VERCLACEADRPGENLYSRNQLRQGFVGQERVQRTLNKPRMDAEAGEHVLRRIGSWAMPFRLCDSENREAGVLMTLTRLSYLLE
jgi:hypothetical protein